MAPLSIASWRFLIASLTLGLILIGREGWPRWSLREWALLATLGLSGVFSYNVFFLYALQRVEAGRGAWSSPSFRRSSRWPTGLLFRIPMSRVKALGVFLAMYGCLLVVHRRSPDAAVHGPARLRRMAARRHGAVVGGLYAALALLHAALHAALDDLRRLLHGLSAADRRSARGRQPVRLLRGNLARRLGHRLPRPVRHGDRFHVYSQAIGRIGSTKAAAFINLVPIFAVLLGALLLGERLGAAILSGGALVICGVLLTNRRGRETASA